MMENCLFVPSRIFSTNKTGVSFVHTNSQVLSVTVTRHVVNLISGEKGCSVAVFCVNATGFRPSSFFREQKCTSDSG